MTARERALRAYGNCCAWCQSPGPLELDHIHNDGAGHRAEIKMKLATWLVRQRHDTGHWPTGFQLLCTPCHDKKSGRITRMPPRNGASTVAASLPDALAAQVALLAAQPDYGTKSAVVQAALQAMLAGTANETALHAVHDHLARVQADLGKTLQAVLDGQREHQEHLVAIRQRIAALEIRANTVDDKLSTLEKTTTKELGALTRAYDQLKTTLADAPKGGMLSRFLG
jgi:Arc/MetJ-type ribon-helix-helix transcriptional regulator